MKRFSEAAGSTLGFLIVAVPFLVVLQYFGLPTDLISIMTVAWLGAGAGKP